MAGQAIGYARVSTADQDLGAQEAALRLAGCDLIFKDVMSGGKDTRPGLTRCLESLRRGDVLLVTRLDRIGRSLSHLLSVIEQLDEKGIGFRSLADHIDTTSAHGKLMLGVLGTVAEFERSLIRERTKSSLAHLKAQGVQLGNPGLVSKDRVMLDRIKSSRLESRIASVRDEARSWKALLLRLRPGVSWKRVTSEINGERLKRQPKAEPYTVERVIGMAKTLIAAGDLPSSILLRSRKGIVPPDNPAEKLARAYAELHPNASLGEIGAYLSSAGYRPKRSDSWSKQSVSNLLKGARRKA